MERAPQYRTRFDAVYEYSKAVFVNSRRYIGAVYRTISTVTLLVMFLVASHASAITDAEIFLTVINKPYTSTTCALLVTIASLLSQSPTRPTWSRIIFQRRSTVMPGGLRTRLCSYQQMTGKTSTTSGRLLAARPSPTCKPQILMITIRCPMAPPRPFMSPTRPEQAKRMRLQYAEQFVDGTLQADKSFRFDLTTLTPPQQSMPYQFTIHPYDDNNENRELAVWLSSTYAANSPTSVRSLYAGGARNHWISGVGFAGQPYIAYVGGLYDYAKSGSAINLVLDMDLDGTQMNLSTNYALFKVVRGPHDTCVTQPGSCVVEFVGQYTTPVSGPITIAGSGRINGYNLLDTSYPGKVG